MTTGFNAAMRPGIRRSRGAVYYRKPDGWIDWGGYDDALQHFNERGFQALYPKYGRISALLKDEEGEDYPDPASVWGPILRHPDGPAEFPIEQIITLRWYQDADCPVPGTRFPQLRGVKVTEYLCPQCKRAPFISAVDEHGAAVISSDGVTGLANHLQIMHGWDRASLNSYGERTGIDFNRVGTAKSVRELGFDDQPAGPEPESAAPEFEVETGTETKATEAVEMTAACECGWEPREDSKNKQASMQTHKNQHCPLREGA